MTRDQHVARAKKQEKKPGWHLSMILINGKFALINFEQILMYEQLYIIKEF